MSRNATPEELQAIDRLLEFLPSFESPEFEPAVWPKNERIDENGVRRIQMPYPEYSEIVEEFRNLYPAFASSVHPYDPLPEDETQGGVPFNVMGATFSEQYFSRATIDQIRRYLMLLGRGERFCDGHIAGEFQEGKVVAALRRLAELRRDMA